MAASPASVQVEVDGVVIAVSNPDKVFFSARGETKLDLVNYYMAVGPGRAQGSFRAAHSSEALSERRGGRFLLPEEGPTEATRLARDRDGLVP